jgi:hypothetical protein
VAAATAQAQRRFAAALGAKRTIDRRALLHTVAATDLGINAVSAEEQSENFLNSPHWREQQRLSPQASPWLTVPKGAR